MIILFNKRKKQFCGGNFKPYNGHIVIKEYCFDIHKLREMFGWGGGDQ